MNIVFESFYILSQIEGNFESDTIRVWRSSMGPISEVSKIIVWDSFDIYLVILVP